MVSRAGAARLDSAGQGLQYYWGGLAAQTFFFGLFSISYLLSTRMLLKRGLNTRVNKVMFGLTTFMYILTAMYWVFGVVDGVDRIIGLVTLGKNPEHDLPDHSSVTLWSPLFNALMLCNYVISDSVVVWRAWIICARNHRKYLWITVFFLVVTALTVFLTIGFRIAGTVVSPIVNLPTSSPIRKAIDILQIVTLFTSLLSNFSATGVVSATALYHFRNIRNAFSDSKARASRSNQILLLVIESGVLYCISALLAMIASIIRLPQGTLGDIYVPINVQIAGAYPSIVLLLANNQKSLDDSPFDSNANSSGAFSTSGMISTPIRFTPGPAQSRTGPRDSTFSAMSDDSESPTVSERKLEPLRREKEGTGRLSNDAFV